MIGKVKVTSTGPAAYDPTLDIVCPVCQKLITNSKAGIRKHKETECNTVDSRKSDEPDHNRR